MYITLPLRIDDANVTQPGVACLHPVSVIQGFTGALEHRLQEKVDAEPSNPFMPSPSIVFTGVSLVHRDFQVYEGVRRGSHAGLVTEKALNKVINPTSPPILRASAQLDIIIQVDCAGLSNDALLMLVTKTVLGMRFLGGNQFISADDPICIATTELELKSQIKQRNSHQPYGWFFQQHRSDAVEKIQQSARTPADGLLKAVAPIRTKVQDKSGKSKNTYQRQSKGWLFPAVIGYQLLESPQQRTGVSRPEYAHAFAEPIYDVVELIPSVRYLKKDNSTLDTSGVLWRLSYDQISQSLYVSTQIGV